MSDNPYDLEPEFSRVAALVDRDFDKHPDRWTDLVLSYVRARAEYQEQRADLLSRRARYLRERLTDPDTRHMLARNDLPGLEWGRLDDSEFQIFEEIDAANPDNPIPRTLNLDYQSGCQFPPELLLEPLSDPADWLAPFCPESRIEAAAIRLVLIHDAWHPGHRIIDRAMQRIGQEAKEFIKLYWLSGIASKTKVKAGFPDRTAAETVRCELDRWLVQVIPAETVARAANGETKVDAGDAGQVTRHPRR